MIDKRRKNPPSPLSRGEIMGRVGQKNTRPELIVRRLLHKLGFRFRLHRRDLPGSPDIVLPKYKLCIFVHGCFWHRHPGCKLASTPANNAQFWNEKFNANIKRDTAALLALSSAGWRSEVIWECETREQDVLTQRIKRIFDK